MIVMILALALGVQDTGWKLSDAVMLENGIYPPSETDRAWVFSKQREGVYLDRWIQVASSDSGKTFLRLADIGSVASPPRPVWFKRNLSRDAKVSWRESKMQVKFDCANETMTTIAIVAYKADGTVYSTVTHPVWEQRAEPVVPDSVAEQMMIAACRK